MMDEVMKDLLGALREIAATNASKHGTQAMMASRCMAISRAAIARAEAALAVTQPDANGLILWRGGKCPVNPFAIVFVEYRNGTFDSKYAAHRYNWESTGSPYDIIAYRIAEAQP